MDKEKKIKNGRSDLPYYCCLALCLMMLLYMIMFPHVCNNNNSDNSNSVSITENIDVQRSIKKANNSSNPINPESTYPIIYLNNTLSADDMFTILFSFTFAYGDAFIPISENGYAYPIYAFQITGDNSITGIFLLYEDFENSDTFTIAKGDLTNMLPQNLYGQIDNYSANIEYNIPFVNYMLPSDTFKTITPYSSISFGGITLPIGIYNSLLTDVVSSVPYDFVCEPSGPIYNLAPQTLVDDVPFNVEYPSGVHSNKFVSPTAYYPSVSGRYYGSVLGNPINTNAQGITYYDYKADLYINSSLRPKHQVFGFDDFISYYDTYDYLFTGFDIVLQTMWGQLPIYFKISTNDFGFAYDVSRLLNESNTIEDYFNLSITSDIEHRYLDYVHINIQFYFNADTNYDSKYFNVNEEYELEGLIPNAFYNGEYIQAEFGYVRYDADSFITNDEVVANGAYQTLRNYRIATSNVLNRIEQAYSDEYEQGYNEGYSAGTIDAGGDNALGPVFAWLSSASSIIANIFSIQIFPYITLGMLLLFPLVVFVIVWILKLFFGG